MRPILPLIALIAALPAWAADAPMTGAEFDAYSRGKTLTYAVGGTVYGAEQYLPGRRVVWAFSQQECRDGVWYEEDGQICFVYEHDPTPQCWQFFLDHGGLRARFMADPPGADLIEVDQGTEPLICAGPDVGV